MTHAINPEQGRFARIGSWRPARPKPEQALAAAATAMGAAALVLPEVWLPGYNQDDIPARALEIDSAPMRRLAIQPARRAARWSLAMRSATG